MHYIAFLLCLALCGRDMNMQLVVFVFASKPFSLLVSNEDTVVPSSYVFSPNKLTASVWISCCVTFISRSLWFSCTLLTSCYKRTFTLVSVPDTAVRVRLIGLLKFNTAVPEILLYCSSRIGTPVIVRLKKRRYIQFVFFKLVEMHTSTPLSLSHWIRIAWLIQSTSNFMFLCGLF
jgi:hypothetical protein